VSGRIAAKRAREAELADTEPVLSKINKIHGSKEQSKNWSASEKEKILEALRKYGTADIPKLQTAVPNRSQEAIKSFVDREKVKMTQVYREIILPDGRMKVVTEPRQMDSPIEQWIAICESKDKRSRADVGYVVPKMLEWISKYEAHPDPEDCEGVDYAAIYKALAMLMQGDIPPKMNIATSRRILQLFSMLQRKVRETSEDVKTEKDYMAACSSRVYQPSSSTSKTGDSPFQSPRSISIPVDGYDETKFLQMPGVNPLNLPHEIFSKPLFERSSSKPEAVIEKPGTIDLSTYV